MTSVMVTKSSLPELPISLQLVDLGPLVPVGPRQDLKDHSSVPDLKRSSHCTERNQFHHHHLLLHADRHLVDQPHQMFHLVDASSTMPSMIHLYNHRLAKKNIAEVQSWLDNTQCESTNFEWKERESPPVGVREEAKMLRALTGFLTWGKTFKMFLSIGNPGLIVDYHEYKSYL